MIYKKENKLEKLLKNLNIRPTFMTVLIDKWYNMSTKNCLMKVTSKEYFKKFYDNFDFYCFENKFFNFFTSKEDKFVNISTLADARQPRKYGCVGGLENRKLCNKVDCEMNRNCNKHNTGNIWVQQGKNKPYKFCNTYVDTILESVFRGEKKPLSKLLQIIYPDKELNKKLVERFKIDFNWTDDEFNRLFLNDVLTSPPKLAQNQKYISDEKNFQMEKSKSITEFNHEKDRAKSIISKSEILLKEGAIFRLYNYETEDEFKKILIEHRNEIINGDEFYFFDLPKIFNKGFNLFFKFANGFILSQKNQEWYIYSLKLNEKLTNTDLFNNLKQVLNDLKDFNLRKEIFDSIYDQINDDEYLRAIFLMQKKSNPFKSLLDIISKTPNFIIFTNIDQFDVSTTINNLFDDLNIYIIIVKTYFEENTEKIIHIHYIKKIIF